MARMIPESPIETESAAERRLFERLRDDTSDELRAKDPNYRGLDYWVEQVRAEREAENAA